MASIDPGLSTIRSGFRTDCPNTAQLIDYRRRGCRSGRGEGDRPGLGVAQDMGRPGRGTGLPGGHGVPGEGKTGQYPGARRLPRGSEHDMNTKLTDAQIMHLARVATWTKGYDVNQHGTRIATLRVLSRRGLIETRETTDRRTRETGRREFVTEAGRAELRRLAAEPAGLDAHVLRRVTEAIREMGK